LRIFQSQTYEHSKSLFDFILSFYSLSRLFLFYQEKTDLVSRSDKTASFVAVSALLV